MTALRRSVAALLLLLVVPVASAQEPREGFALVLGGGGAKGLAHIGVVRALEELGLTPSLVVGTSMGAIVGSLVATGHDADAMQALITDRNWQQTLFDQGSRPIPIQGGWSSLPRSQLRLHLDTWPPTLPTGASHGHTVEALIGRQTADACFAAGNDLDALPVPFRCVSTDLLRGVPVVFERGSLPRMVRASGGLPLVFHPTLYRGLYLVDGGFVENLPLRVARELGYERALVVDVTGAWITPDAAPTDLFGLLRRSTQLAQLAENRIDPGPGDVVLRVDVGGYGAMSFWSASDIVELGYEQAMAIRDELVALGEAAAPASMRAPPSGIEIGPVLVARVEVRGNERLSAWSIRKRMDLAAGDRVDLEEIHTRARDLSRQSIFESVWVEIVPTVEGTAHVIVHVVERDRPELEFATNYRDDIGPAALFRLRLDNRLGAGGGRTLSWQVSGERASVALDTSVPVQGSRRVEFRAGGRWVNEEVEVERPSSGDDAWVFTRTGGSFAIVSAFDEGDPALHLGMEAYDGNRHLVSRDPAGDGDLRWRAVVVGLETWPGGGLNTWPDEGLSVRARLGLEMFGGRSDAWSVEGGWIRRPLLGRRVGINLTAGGAWSSSHLPVDLQPRAGGPWGWVGQDRDAIVAPKLAWGRLGIEYRFGRELRAELAGAMGWSGVGSLRRSHPVPGLQIQLIWESGLGPVHLGWAGGEGSQPRLVFDVGHEF